MAATTAGDGKGAWSMADLARSAIALDDPTPLYRAQLFSMMAHPIIAANVPAVEAELARRADFGETFDSGFLHRDVVCLACHNSERSQMAEAVLNAKYGARFNAFSAGTEPSGRLDERAVAVMHEIGLDISKNRVKSVDEFIRPDITFDYVVTTCDDSKRTCPYIPAPEQVHANFDDPQPFYGTDEEKLQRMRAVRDQVVKWVDQFFGPRASLLELEKQPVR
jgi:arsenate reductase